jgi:hypothetical protein
MSLHTRCPRILAATIVALALGAAAACGGAEGTAPRADTTGTGPTGPTFGSSDVFVSPAGDNANPGTRQAPVASIRKAVSLADSGATVRVAGGTYAEVVEAKSHVYIAGGYDPVSWNRDTAAHRTAIVNLSGAVVAQGVKDVQLDGLFLSNDSAAIRAVVSLEASTGFVIRGSTIVSGRGGDATAVPDFIPAIADKGADGGEGKAADFCPPSKTGGAGGSGGAGGDGGGGGTGGAVTGFAGSAGKGSGAGAGGAGGAVASAGSAGKPASRDGAAGSDGAPDVTFGKYSIPYGYVPGKGMIGDQGENGPGGGGGGGGGGPVISPMCGGGGGGGGEGGQGGAGGSGGFSGGASIGIALQAGSELLLESSVVITAGGGRGADGGRGQYGGRGGSRGAGGYGDNLTGRGGDGGAGGNGGDGGWGGAGSGGPSIGVMVSGGGSYTASAVTYRVGPGGAPGAGHTAASSGVKGDSAWVLTVAP